jgi:membrane fusion protein, adhesin transport system
VRPSDIGFVKVGHEVKIKLTAYEYTVYGGLSGQVQSISPDAISDVERSLGGEGSYYRALVRADASALKAGRAEAPSGAASAAVGDRSLQVLPGMTGTAEIRTGQRSVLAFLLRPMLKTTEAFRER